MKFQRPHILFLAALFPILNSFAQSPDSLRMHHLEAVEVMSIRPLKENKGISNLTLSDQLSHDAGAILSRIPSLSGIRKGGGYGYDPVLRGFKYSQLGILIDGIQTSTVACPNRMDPPTSQVSVNSISRVELYKGPYSLRYGNNIGGVVNFISTDQIPSDEDGVFSRISSAYESNGNIIRSEVYSAYRSKKSAYHLAGSWNKGGDYLNGNGDLVDAAFTRANIGFGGNFLLSDKQEISGKITRNFARNADYAALPMDLRSDDTWMMHLKHSALLGEKASLTTSMHASLVDHLMDNLNKNLDPRMVNASTEIQTRNFGARTELKRKEMNAELNSGFDFRYENADGYRSREFLMGPMTGNTLTDNVWQNGHIATTGAFAEYSLFRGSWKYKLSGRLDLNAADAPDPDAGFEAMYTSLNSLQVNPGLTGGVEYSTPSVGLSLWGGRVQRSGDLSERFMNSFPVGLDPYELLGNPGLKPEVNNQADFIIDFTMLRNLKIKADFFYSYLNNFISSSIREDLSPKMPTAPGVRQYNNIEKASIIGAEFTMMLTLPLHLQGDMSLSLLKGTNLVSTEPLPEIPPLDFRTTIRGSYFQNRIIPAIHLRYVNQQDRVSIEFGESTTPSFFLMDAEFSYQASKWLLFSGGVRNLFDVTYYEHLNRSVLGNGNPIYNPGRSIFIALSLMID